VFSAARKALGSPRSVTFNAHGFRVAVNRSTGEVRVLHSVHAADAGTIINPAQVRGQIEGGVVQGLGFALTERHLMDDEGRVRNASLREYRIPAFADAPRTEIHYVESDDSLGPLGSKGIAECCINPVAPALANAIANATDARLRDLPFRPPHVLQGLAQLDAGGATASSG
jgi:putative selenate reductase molybdopterin-binding subunit